jgi:hypothetical protein
MEHAENQTFERINSGLTEDVVKQRFVPFLKDFYRHRYEPAADSFAVNLDNVSEGGLVADIVMTFKTSDDKAFTCACEATSRDKSGEVKFELNLVYFIWDAVAFGAFFSAVVYAFFYETRLQWLLDLHKVGNLGLIIGTFTIGFFGWYFSMQRWRKYRYIYAVEQFKRYEADDQWIALAEDVFPSPNDPYLLELKNQCIYNGFGLAIVPTEGAVRVLNSPSRLGTFGKDRKLAHWVTRSQWYQKAAQTMTPIKMTPPDAVQVYWNKIKSWAQYLVIEPFKKYVWSILSKPFGQTVSVYNRFMTGQTVQKWMFALCTLALVPMCYDVLSYSTEEIADLEKLQNWRGGRNPEDQAGGWVFDGAPIPYDGKPTGVPKQYPISKNAPDEEDIPTINLSGEEEEGVEYAEKPKNKPAQKAKPKSDPASQTAAALPPDPCARLKGKTGWLIQDNSFNQQDYAAARASSLRAKGVSAQSAPRSCIEAGAKGYIVWLSGVQSSEEAARKTAATLEKTLQQKGLLKGKLLVRKI